MSKLVARSASDRTEDWPFWIIWDGQINVTLQTMTKVYGMHFVGMPFLPRKTCEAIVELANNGSTNLGKEEFTKYFEEK